MFEIQFNNWINTEHVSEILGAAILDNPTIYIARMVMPRIRPISDRRHIDEVDIHSYQQRGYSYNFLRLLIGQLIGNKSVILMRNMGVFPWICRSSEGRKLAMIDFVLQINDDYAIISVL